MIVIDGTDHVLGRLCSAVAQKLLKGKQLVYIVNAEKIVIVGKEEAVMHKFIARQGLTVKGNLSRVPKFPRMPDRLVKYAVRGMLPYPERRGRIALKKFKAFIGVPKELEGKKFSQVENAKNKASFSSMTMGQISTKLGVKW